MPQLAHWAQQEDDRPVEQSHPSRPGQDLLTPSGPTDVLAVLVLYATEIL